MREEKQNQRLRTHTGVRKQILVSGTWYWLCTIRGSFSADVALLRYEEVAEGADWDKGGENGAFKLYCTRREEAGKRSVQFGQEGDILLWLKHVRVRMYVQLTASSTHTGCAFQMAIRTSTRIYVRT